MEDFEVMPIGTKKRIEELEKAMQEFALLFEIIGVLGYQPSIGDIITHADKFKQLLEK